MIDSFPALPRHLLYIGSHHSAGGRRSARNNCLLSTFANPATMPTAQEAPEQYPLQGATNDGWNTDDEATATCQCGKVQMVVVRPALSRTGICAYVSSSQPLKKPGFVTTFVCHCSDCRKVSASAFATNLTTLDSHTRFTRGEDNLSTWAQSKTIGSGHEMANSFCKTCGTLMFRKGTIAPGTRFMRGGIIDNHALHDTFLKPDVELYTEHRAKWVSPVEGAEQGIGMSPFQKKSNKM